MLIPPIVVWLLFPALSIAVPLALRLVPCAERSTGAGQEAMPEIASEQVKLTVTLVLFQPYVLAGGAVAPVMVGGTVSMLTVAVLAEPIAAPTFPTPSVAAQLMLFVPLAEALSVWLAVAVPPPVSAPSMKPPRLFEQVILVTLEGSVTVTLPSTGTWPGVAVLVSDSTLDGPLGNCFL